MSQKDSPPESQVMKIISESCIVLNRGGYYKSRGLNTHTHGPTYHANGRLKTDVKTQHQLESKVTEVRKLPRFRHPVLRRQHCQENNI